MAGFKRNQQKFLEFYLDQGIEHSLAESYSNYAARLVSRNLPVIFEIEQLSLRLMKSRSYLASVINAPLKHYRSFRIPKKRGGFREISAPYPALLDCQQWILKNIISKIRIEKCAHAYVSERSIISNAGLHKAAKALYKVDVKDFFPSIKIDWVVKVFLTAGYAPNVSYYLAALCCDGNGLPQGAATSPCLSNIVCKKMDKRLISLAEAWGLTYTRYADDMCFSGDYVAEKFMEIVCGVIGESGFQVNEEKTKLLLGKTRKMVTGINVAGERLKISSKYKRELKKVSYYIGKYGLQSHLSKLKVRDPHYLDRLIGRAAYWASVETWNEDAYGVWSTFVAQKKSHGFAP